MMKYKILFLAANPAGMTALALDEECRQITEKIRSTDHRDSLELITRWAVRPEDLLQHLNEHRPHVVHFSGHGTSTEEIVLLDKNKNPMMVPAPALKKLFTTLKDNIRVLVLNACFSRPQAAAITEIVDCAVGMNKAIGDDAAIAFAAAFYQAIGFGRSVKAAFESGNIALMLAGIPEEATPQLLCRKGVDPASIILIEPNIKLVNPLVGPSDSAAAPQVGLKSSELRVTKDRASKRLSRNVTEKVHNEGEVLKSDVVHCKQGLREQQFTILKQVASLVYRTRNEARTLNEAMRAPPFSVSGSEIEELLAKHAEIKELLFDEIAVLPPVIFKILHRQGHALYDYCIEMEMMLKEKGKRHAKMDTSTSLEERYLLLDEGYHQLTKAIQAELGVS